jgi:hypothetical protein
VRRTSTSGGHHPRHRCAWCASSTSRWAHNDLIIAHAIQSRSRRQRVKRAATTTRNTVV